MEGWGEYQKLVLSELERHSDVLMQIQMDVQGLRVEVEKLKIRAAIWGAVAGAIPVLFAAAYQIMRT